MTVTAVVLGAGLGFLSSTPLGPINLNVVRWSRQGQLARLWWFVAGVIVADVAVAASALKGLLAVHLSSEAFRWIGLIGGVFFILHGGWGLRRGSGEPDSTEIKTTGSAVEGLTAGFLFCALNPAFYFFWLYGSGVFVGWSDGAAQSVLFFLTGVLVGDLLWFVSFVKLITRLRNRLSMSRLELASSALILCFGVYSIWRSLDGTGLF